MKQTKQVIRGFKITGTKIARVEIDGKRKRMRRGNLLRKNDDANELDFWLKEEQCSFANLVDQKFRTVLSSHSTSRKLSHN